MTSIFTKESDRLFQALLSLKTPEEYRLFFEDLCTVGEIQALAQRYQVAGMLKAKKNYQEIAAATGASSATISRVNRCLRYGSGGYTMALERSNDAD